MRVSGIKVGHTYTDRNGRQRTVYDIGIVGLIYSSPSGWRACNFQTFARWAKADVTEDYYPETGDPQRLKEGMHIVRKGLAHGTVQRAESPIWTRNIKEVTHE